MICTHFRESYDTSCSASGSSSGSATKRLCRRRRQYHYPDWSKIDADILEYIQKKLPLADILRSRAVCSSWRSITKTNISSSLNPPPPPPILWGRRFLNVSKDEVNLYVCNKKSEQLLAEQGICVGYSNGYFLFLDREEGRNLYLFHPFLFSGTTARFPLIEFPKSLDCKRVSKALLWANPISGNGSHGIVLIHRDSRRLLFAKCGATQFTELERQDESTHFVDILCIKKFIYAITGLTGGRFLKAWDCSKGDVPRKVLDLRPSFSIGHYPSLQRTLHLVESQGELLLVAIVRADPRDVRANKSEPMCKVYKMDFKRKKWVHMSSLGDRVLFVMEFQTMSLSSHQFPQYEKNSVYFRYYVLSVNLEYRVGVFNMGDGSMKVINVDVGTC